MEENWRNRSYFAFILYSCSPVQLVPNLVWLQCTMWWTAFWFPSEFRAGWPRWHCAEPLKWLVFLYQIIYCWLAVLYSPFSLRRGLVLVYGFIFQNHKRAQSQFSPFQLFSDGWLSTQLGPVLGELNNKKNVTAALMKNERYLWNKAKDEE